MVLTTCGTGLYYNPNNSGCCRLKVRTTHDGGAQSELVMYFDNYHDGANAFLAVGGKFPADKLDEQLGWSGETVCSGRPSERIIILNAEQVGKGLA
jgi:hypothetical protein